jgi:hypothetical protein
MTIIYVVSSYVANYDESESNVLIAFADLAKAQAMVTEYNERPTVRVVIEEMRDAFIETLRNQPPSFPPPMYDPGPRPVFDQTRFTDPLYQAEHKRILRQRRKAQRDYDDSIVRYRGVQREAFKAQTDEFVRSIDRETVMHEQKMIGRVLRDERTTYDYIPTEFVA